MASCRGATVGQLTAEWRDLTCEPYCTQSGAGMGDMDSSTPPNPAAAAFIPADCTAASPNSSAAAVCKGQHITEDAPAGESTTTTAVHNNNISAQQ